MNNRITRFSLLVTLLLTTSLTTPTWADTATVDGVTYTYTISNEGVILTDASGYGSSIIIPSQLGGKDVVVIGKGFLYGKDDIDNVKTVTIPATVTCIEEDAFDDDWGSTNELETVVFLGADGAGALTIADDDSFKEATKVTLDRNLSSESVTGLFAGAKTVTIGSHVTKLISNGFNGATSLTTLDMSGATSLVTIGDQAFYHNSLSEVTIPGTVTYIGNDAFDVSSTSNDIKKVVFLPVPEGQENKPLKIVDTANFKSATDIYLARTIDSASGTTGAGSSLFAAAVNVYIKPGCTAIPAICFNENDNLTKLDFTNASELTSIAEKAFYGCDGLTKLTFPASLTTIGSNAFYSCDGLLDVDMGYCTTMTAIADNTFDECTAINHLVLPPNVVTIGKMAFYRNSLTQLTVPATCNLIDEDAFDVQGVNDITVLTLLGSDTAGELTIIDDDNFQSVTSLNLDRHLSSSCTLPVFASLTGASVGAHVKRLNTVPFKGTNIKTLNLTLATALEAIDASAFEGCDDLMGVDLTASTLLTSIGEKAFYDCTSIETLKLPASLTTLGVSAFENCHDLKSLDLSALEGLTVIPELAFDECDDLETLILPPYVQTLGKYSFYSNVLSEITIPASCTLIDDDALDGLTLEGGLFYNNITKATLLGSAEASPLTIIDDATFTKVETLVLDRDLVTPDAEEDDLFPDVVSLTVGEHVHAINPYCFCGCHNLESADFSKATALTSIGKCAFYECTNDDFTTLDLSKCTALSTIGEAAFEDCDDLTTITFPASLQTISKRAFYEVPIKTVTIPASVTTIDENAFGYDLVNMGFDFYHGVENVTFAGSATAEKLTNVDDDCFANATYVYLDRVIDTPSESFDNVETLVIGPHVTSIAEGLFASSDVETVDATRATALTTIGAKAFAECGSLTSINLSKCTNLTTIGKEAFYYCDDLMTCPLPNTLKTIGESAFNMCRSMTTSNLPTGLTSIGKAAFSSCEKLTMDCVWPVAITAIPENVFSSCSSMTSITLPEGITSIGKEAFYYSGLQNIVVPSTVTTIGRSALTVYDGTKATIEFKGADDAVPLIYDDYHCPANTVLIDRDITIGNAPEGYELENGLFSLAHTLTVGPHTTVLADGLCNKGKVAALNLSSATSLATIGTNTFANNSTLTTVTLPASVTTIGTKAFYNCTALMSVDMSAATGLTTIKESTFDECTELSSLKLPEGLQTIGKAAFYRNSLTEVTIPSTVTVINEDAFDVMGSSNDIVSVTFSGNEKSRGSSLKIINAANFKSATSIYLDRDISSDSSDKLFASARIVTTGPDVTLLNTKPFGSVALTHLTMQSIPLVSAGALSSVISAELDLSDASYITIGATTNKLPSFVVAQYTRQMSSHWGTLVLPFDVQSTDDVQFYAVAAMDDDGVDAKIMTLTPIDNVKANQPCIFYRKTGSQEVVFESLGEVTSEIERADPYQETAVEGCLIYGRYQTIDMPIELMPYHFYYIASDKFWYAEKDFTLPAFRAALAFDASTASSINLRVDEGTTGIMSIFGDENTDDAVYDLQGRKVERPEHGLYIIGGKKVLKR